MLLQRVARIRVQVESWKIRARDVYSNTMSLTEYVRRRRDVDRQSIDPAWLHERGLFQGIAITRSLDRVANVQIKPKRVVFVRRAHIDQLGGEVRVRRVRADPQFHFDWTGTFDLLFGRRRLVQEDVPTFGRRERAAVRGGRVRTGRVREHAA